MIRTYFLIRLLLGGGQIFASNIDAKVKDSLQSRDYNYLLKRIQHSKEDNQQQATYLDYFLSKAKLENNSEKVVSAYKNYVYYSSENLRPIYADSMIIAAIRTKKNDLIGAAFLANGNLFYNEKKYSMALHQYLLANDYISKTNDEQLAFELKYDIARIKHYLGLYHEAVILYKECITYFNNVGDSRAYLNTLHSLGVCYNKLGEYSLCTEINQKGISEDERHFDNEMKSYFIHSEGINQYSKSNFTTAVQMILSSLPMLLQTNDFGNESIAYFYIGKSYWNLKSPELAIPYFKKVDSIFETKGYIRQDLRENFELLLNNYKSKNNPKLQLHYIKKLIKVDSTLNTRYRDLSGRIYKEYDTKELLLEKQKAETSLERRKYNDFIFGVLIAGLSIALLSVAYHYLKTKRRYREKFKQLINKKSITVDVTKNLEHSTLQISQDTVNSILKKLEKFENDKKFLEKDLTSIKLAVAFDSNAKYLSKIIQQHRGKNFVGYINDLKVDYVISLLKGDSRTRNYTNKALAEEAGFSSTQRFANAFFARTGMPTAYFIEEIKKKQ